jgi:hypothetical protein
MYTDNIQMIRIIHVNTSIKNEVSGLTQHSSKQLAADQPTTHYTALESMTASV